MRILVIGGSGFVSGTLVNASLAAGHAVWTVTRGRRAVPAGATALVADRHDPAAMSAAIGQAGVRWDLVVDCIGFARADAAQDAALFSSRADHLVFISTDFVYDPARRQFPQAEDAAGYAAGDGYGPAKRQCELELLNAAGPLPWTILRPCHIYGPGSELGCLPGHGRDAQLIDRLRRGEPLRLVGGGRFLQQPVFARDLAETILSCAGNARSHGQVFNVAGPDVVESREYYRIVADELGVALKVEELPVDAYLAAHPEAAPFLCHRFYHLGRAAACGLKVPATPLAAGLRQHVLHLLARQ